MDSRRHSVLARYRMLVALLGFAGVAIGLWFVVDLWRPLPSRTFVMATGEPGGAYSDIGERYRAILARDGIDLQLRPSAGAAENLDLLRDPASGVMAAFVQGGAVPEQATDELVSLGAMFYEPMWLFVRGDQPLPSLHHLKGLRLAIGAPGSGSRVMALALLRLNGIATSQLELLEISPDVAADRLESGDIDAAFMSLAWEAPVIRRLLLAPGIHLQGFPLAATPAAVADEVNLLETSGYASLGTFINGSKLKIRLDGEAGEAGTDVDWNDTFGDDDVTRFRLDGLWRFANRHYLRFLYTDYSRSRTSAFDEDIEWGGEVIPAEIEVKAELGFEIIALAYQYAFLKRENYELSGTIGLHYTTFDASLRAEVELPGEEFTEERGGTASVDAPLPVIGLHGLWNIGRNFYLEGQAQFFTISMDGLDGDIINYRAALIWQPKKYIGLGAGYDYFEVDVDATKNRFTGSMTWEYSGPQIFFNIGF